MRFESDLSAVHGSAVLSLPYEKLFGLWLNLPRARTAAAAVAMEGIIAARGNSLPQRWFDGVCLLEEDVDEVMIEENLQRAEARLMAEIAAGGAGG